MLRRFNILDLTDTSVQKKYFRKLVGNTDIEDSLQRLDKLTQEARMASAESLKVTHNVDAEVLDVDDRVRDVGGKVDDVQGDVQDVGNKVQDVDYRVQGICSDFNDIYCGVREVNRSSSLSPLLVVLRARTMTQRISSEIVFTAQWFFSRQHI
jgi:hypothetical protein